MPPACVNATSGPSIPTNRANATMSANSSGPPVFQSHTNNVNKREKHSQTPKRSGSELIEEGRREKKKPRMDLRAIVGAITSSLQTDGKDKEKKKKRRRRKKRPVSSARTDSVQPSDSVSTLSTGFVEESLVTQSTADSIVDTAEPIESSEDELPTYSSSDKGKGKARSVASSSKGSTRGSPTSSRHLISGSSSRTAIANETSEIKLNAIDRPESDAQVQEISRLKEQLAEQRKLLEKHQRHLQQQQQALTCQICLDLMHRPYALAPCGHVTCYGCLVRWFTALQNPIEGLGNPEDQEQQGGDEISQILNNAAARRGTFIRRRKTCPLCRATVSARPVEMWDIKNMVSALTKSHLVDLPQSPSSAREENGDNNDRRNANNDPWRNIFRPPPGSFDHPPGPDRDPGQEEDREGLGWFDEEDGGVYRCIDCFHEIWDGVCSGCERVYGRHLADEDDDSDYGPPWPLWDVDDDESSLDLERVWEDEEEGEGIPDHDEHDMDGDDIWLEHEEGCWYEVEDAEGGLEQLEDELDHFERTVGQYRYLDEDEEEFYQSYDGDAGPGWRSHSEDQDNGEEPENYATTEPESEPEVPRNRDVRQARRPRYVESDDESEGNIPIESDSDVPVLPPRRSARVRATIASDDDDDDASESEVARWAGAQLQRGRHGYADSDDDDSDFHGLRRQASHRSTRRSRVVDSGSDEERVVWRGGRRIPTQQESGYDSEYSY